MSRQFKASNKTPDSLKANDSALTDDDLNEMIELAESVGRNALFSGRRLAEKTKRLVDEYRNLRQQISVDAEAANARFQLRRQDSDTGK